MMDWLQIDLQIRPWETRLRDDLGLSSAQAGALASCIGKEVTALATSQKEKLRQTSPIPMASRLEEIIAFQSWMDIASDSRHPAITRAQVITQNYICFVYLKESWFEVLRQEMPQESATFLCCEFLLSEPLRRFRNAFAHGNWGYLHDFSGLEFWARARDSGKQEVRSVVLQLDLSFWQTISRCTAYTSMVSLA